MLSEEGGAYSVPQCNNPRPTRGLIGWGTEMYLLLRNSIPWEAFNQLESLSIELGAEEIRRVEPDDPNDTYELFLTGPSRPPRLSSLSIILYMNNEEIDKESLQSQLKMLNKGSLDRTLADHDSFPALRTFQTEIKFVTSSWCGIKIGQLIRDLKEQLPSVFGPVSG